MSRNARITKADSLCIAVCIAAIAYLLFSQPLLLAVLGCSSIVFLSLWHISRAVPILEKTIGSKIRFWHIATAIIGVTTFLGLFEMPAQAFLLDGLETFFTQLATDSAQGGGTAIPDTAIRLVFNLIRGAFLLLVAAAALFAYNQAQQGNDWRPIVTQVAIAFSMVFAIDIITFLFVPTT